MAGTTKKSSTGNISPDEYSRGTVCHSSLGLKFQGFSAFPKLTASLRSSQNEVALKMLAVGDFHSKRFTFYDGAKKSTSSSEILPVTHPTLLFILPVPVGLPPIVPTIRA